MPQHLIDLFLFLWSTFHDALYVGVYLLGQKVFRWYKAEPTLEERLDAVEDKLEDHLDDEAEASSKPN